jgi:DNA-binding NtrC family response regulator
MKKRLLIIEDEESLQQSLEVVLADCYDLLFAETAEDAWELLFFFGEGVDLIVTDILLPGMDGLEFLLETQGDKPLDPCHCHDRLFQSRKGRKCSKSKYLWIRTKAL